MSDTSVTIKLDDLIHLHKIISIYEQALNNIRLNFMSQGQVVAIADSALAQDLDKEEPNNVN